MQYDEEKIIKNMKDAGCNDACIQEFLKKYESGSKKQWDRVLSQHRKELLDRMHEEQRKIDCLDYLSFRLASENTGK